LPLATIYCIYIQQAVPTQLQQDTNWCRSLGEGLRVVKLLMFWVELIRLERQECFHTNRYITVQGHTQGGGLGLKPPSELDILQKLNYLRKVD